MATNLSVKDQSKKELSVTRLLNAPIDLVWKTWTEAEHILRWWGPKDYTSPTCKIDLRVGGKYLFCMRAPAYQGGQDFYSTGVFQKIVPQERLEFTQCLSDPQGNVLDPVQVGMPPDFPKETFMVVVFKAVGAKTELTITGSDWREGQMFEMAVMGWNQSLDKMEQALAA